ncbi:pseudouridine-5'-phosphate glycosidase [Microbacterium lacus]|uniref:Pseudouridine-5'-phosphate glycosidase n=1 Tax=Microbacterium lacus TaxID=415217 RepID=A0ABP4RXR9_9MICO
MSTAHASAIVVSDEIAEATAAGRPVVALESTIFTHGLPRPINEEVALEAEDIVRQEGAVPATIGIVAGTAVVGLSNEQIHQLSNETEVVKVSQRDLAVVAAKRLSGGTTVAATAFLAHHAGIRVFSTGGLGGVHQGASETFDESADLTTLAGVPIVIVSAGVKSILDIPATLERLETLNITVLGFGTNAYPGFYVTESGSWIEYAVDAPEEVAAVLRAQVDFGLSSAVLVANPISREKQLDPDEHARVIGEAWARAAAGGIAGNATTPFLLDYIQRATKGESLRVNIDVYRSNARLGAQIARAAALS